MEDERKDVSEMAELDLNEMENVSGGMTVVKADKEKVDLFISGKDAAKRGAAGAAGAAGVAGVAGVAAPAGSLGALRTTEAMYSAGVSAPLSSSAEDN